MKKRRSTSALMDRAAPPQFSLKRVRQLASMGLSEREIAAQLGCPPERLQEPEVRAMVAKAGVAGLLALHRELWEMAQEGCWPATKFLIKNSDRAREFDLEEASAYLQELWEEKFQAHETGDAAREQELAADIEAVHGLIASLCVQFNGQWAPAREPKRRGRATATVWARHLERMTARREQELSQMTLEELDEERRRIAEKLARE